LRDFETLAGLKKLQSFYLVRDTSRKTLLRIEIVDTSLVIVQLFRWFSRNEVDPPFLFAKASFLLPL
jgi:hypothetical protein